MSNLPFHEQQLEFMRDLAQNRPEFFNPLFQFLNYFDTPYFSMILIPIIWLGYSYQWGLRILYWITFNGLVVTLLKNSFGWPRPSADLPAIGLFHPTDFGFPSGGAQLSMFLGSLLIYYWRTKTALAVGLTYILLISFSRLYLGVHYPLDILGGWTIAWLLLFLFIITKKPLERLLIKKGPLFCLILSLAIPFAIMCIARKPQVNYMMGPAMGVGIGTYFSLKNHLFLPPPKNLATGISRSFIGIALIFLIVLLVPSSLHFTQTFIAGLLVSFAASPICKWITN